MAANLATLSPLWGQFNPMLARRIPRLAYFPANVYTDYIDTPDSNPLDSLRFNHTIKFYIRPDAWTAVFQQVFFVWGATYNSNWAFRCLTNAFDQLLVEYSTNGSSMAVAIDADISSFIDGVGMYIAVCYQAFPSASKVYSSPDNKNWTLLNGGIFGGSKTLYNCTSTFKVGGGIDIGATSGFKGYIGKLRGRPSYDQLVTNSDYLLFDPDNYVSGSTFNCPLQTPFNSQTWTLRGNSSIVGPML